MLGRTVAFEELAEAIIQSVRAAGVELGLAAPADVDPKELEVQRRLHVSDEWLRRR
jgi:hypothetical protein